MQIGLIIDANSIKNTQLKNNTNGTIIFLVINEEYFKKLESLNVGVERSSFINSPSFVNNIIYYLY